MTTRHNIIRHEAAELVTTVDYETRTGRDEHWYLCEVRNGITGERAEFPRRTRNINRAVEYVTRHNREVDPVLVRRAMLMIARVDDLPAVEQALAA